MFCLLKNRATALCRSPSEAARENPKGDTATLGGHIPLPIGPVSPVVPHHVLLRGRWRTSLGQMYRIKVLCFEHATPSPPPPCKCGPTPAPPPGSFPNSLFCLSPSLLCSGPPSLLAVPQAQQQVLTSGPLHLLFSQPDMSLGLPASPPSGLCSDVTFSALS